MVNDITDYRAPLKLDSLLAMQCKYMRFCTSSKTCNDFFAFVFIRVPLSTFSDNAKVDNFYVALNVPE